MNKKEVKLIAILELYLFFTLILYYFGPLNFERQNTLLVLFFVTIYQISLYLGFRFGVSNIKIRSRFKVKSGQFKKWQKTLALNGVILLNSFFAIMTISQKLGSFSVGSLIQSIIYGYNNAGDSYAQTLETSATFQGSWVTALNTLTTPLTFLMIPICVYYFKKLNISTKILFVIAVILNLAMFFLTGTNIGIFRVFTVIIGSFLLKDRVQKKAKKGTQIATIVLAIILIVAFLVIFSNNVTSRIPNMGRFISGVPIDFQNILLQILPQGLQVFFILFVSYISQGYYGMSLAFNYPWESTFPFGSSMFLMSNSASLGFNPQAIFEQTYMYKMNWQWSSTVNWHTAYTWIANDISFVGVIVFMLFLGLLLGITFREARSNNILSISLFPLLLMIVLFLPMNNNVLSNPLTFMPTATYVILFFLLNKISIVRRVQS